MLSKLKVKLRHWLGISELSNSVNGIRYDQTELRSFVSDQTNMIGIDTALKHDQTVIIFVSRLGREGGTVQIKSAYFTSYGQLMDFIQYVDRSFDPKKVAIDAPYGMGRMIEEERRRRRR